MRCDWSASVRQRMRCCHFITSKTIYVLKDEEFWHGANSRPGSLLRCAIYSVHFSLSWDTTNNNSAHFSSLIPIVQTVGQIVFRFSTELKRQQANEMFSRLNSLGGNANNQINEPNKSDLYTGFVCCRGVLHTRNANVCVPYTLLARVLTNFIWLWFYPLSFTQKIHHMNGDTTAAEY